MTPEVFARHVEADWERLRGGPATVPDEEITRLSSFFVPPPYERLPGDDAGFRAAIADNRAFGNWVKRNVFPHKVPGYAVVTLSLKKTGVPPGDATSDQMDTVADLADAYSFGALRVSHEQNLIFTDVKQSALLALWGELKALGFATPNIGLLTDIICCPGGDFCSLANAKSIPIAEAIQRRFDDLDYLYDIGELELNISGCMNACGHHHVGNIGVLGVDKNGEEWYQVSIGGGQGEHASLGKVIGPSFAANEMPDVVGRLIDSTSKAATRTSASSIPSAGSASNRSRGASMPRLIKDNVIVEDRWTLLREAASPADVPDGAAAIVPLALWRAERDALRARGEIGVWLKPDDDPELLAADVGALPLIAVDFPQFTDGRGYSTARLLREKHGFAGELRAIGDVLRDQLYYLRQCGFNAFAVRSDRNLEAALKGLSDFSDNYQATAARPVPLFRRRAQAVTDGPSPSIERLA